MADVFRCIDPCGREIVLTQERWLNHVVARRAEFLDQEDVVRATLTNPDLVNHDRQHPLREVFYRASPLSYPFGGLLVRVIVEFYATGEVVTAHFIEQPHRKEPRKWP